MAEQPPSYDAAATSAQYTHVRDRHSHARRARTLQLRPLSESPQPLTTHRVCLRGARTLQLPLSESPHVHPLTTHRVCLRGAPRSPRASTSATSAGLMAASTGAKAAARCSARVHPGAPVVGLGFATLCSLQRRIVLSLVLSTNRSLGALDTARFAVAPVRRPRRHRTPGTCACACARACAVTHGAVTGAAAVVCTDHRLHPAARKGQVHHGDRRWVPRPRVSCSRLFNWG